MRYPVLWINLWKKLSRFMSIAILLPVSLIFIIRFFKNDMSIETTFEHVSMAQLFLILLGIILFSVLFSFLIAISFKFAAIEIKDEYLIGRNYWFFKTKVPINAIEKLYPFSNNGIEAIVADAGSFGKVYISTHTDKLEELLEYLESSNGVSGA